MRLLSRAGFLELCVNGGKNGVLSRTFPPICKFPAFHRPVLGNQHCIQVLPSQLVHPNTHISSRNYGDYYLFFLIKTRLLVPPRVRFEKIAGDRHSILSFRDQPCPRNPEMEPLFHARSIRHDGYNRNN
jgi:hypothetical protein